MSSIRNQHCPNKYCTFYGRIGSHNVIIHNSKNQRFQCKQCKKTWSKHQNDIRFGLKVDSKVLKKALDSFKEGTSIREIARLCNVNPSTIQRWKKRKQTIDRNNIFNENKNGSSCFKK